MKNTKAIILNSYPKFYPEEKNVTLTSIKVGHCALNQIVIRLMFISVDPYMRNRLREEGASYIKPLEIGKPISSMGIGQVQASQAANFKEGDIVMGMLPWQETSIVDSHTVKHLPQIEMPLTAHLSILGYPGLTAYVGVHKIAKPHPGQTFFVSSAAGAVGSLAGQLAKIQGCYVVGSTGTLEKKQYLLQQCHFDAAFNYNQYHNNFSGALKKYCPQGIDINFENVGSKMLEAAIENLNPFATIVLCGAISQYNTAIPRLGPRNFYKINAKNAKLEGYIVTDYEHLIDEFHQYMFKQYQAKKITYQENIVKGLDKAWLAFIGLFSGKNIGKMLVAID